MVVMLGAASKHSLYESPEQSTHLLKQSVKMSAGEQEHAEVACPPALVASLVCFFPMQRLPKPPLTFIAAAIAAPLLI